jgi:hypothetical protein
MGLAFIAGVENTRNIHNADSGPTLSTFSAEPRIKLPIGKTISLSPLDLRCIFIMSKSPRISAIR